MSVGDLLYLHVGDTLADGGERLDHLRDLVLQDVADLRLQLCDAGGHVALLLLAAFLAALAIVLRRASATLASIARRSASTASMSRGLRPLRRLCAALRCTARRDQHLLDRVFRGFVVALDAVRHWPIKRNAADLH